MIIAPRDSRELRQGDIIADVIFPLQKFGEDPRVAARYKSGAGAAVQVSPILQGPTGRPRIIVEVEAVVSYAAVLSQCCDVDIKQNPPPPAFVLCRVTPAPDGAVRNAEWLQVLKENGDPAANSAAFHGLFYLGEINGKSDMTADFSQTLTVDWREYKNILKRRMGQLPDLERNKFRVRAGYHFGRPADEDRLAGLEYPWP